MVKVSKSFVVKQKPDDEIAFELTAEKPKKTKKKPGRADGRPWNSWLSFVTFTWVSPIIAQGNKTTLSHEDLFTTPVSEDVTQLRKSFWEYVGGHERNDITRGELFRALLFVCKRDIILSGIAMFFFAAGQIANPILLRELINAVADGGDEGLYFSLALFGAALISAFSSQIHYHFAFSAGRKSRALFSSLVYEHTVRMTGAMLADTSSGVIINLMSQDAQKFFELSQFMHLFWAAPLLIIVAVVYLLIMLGLPALAGIAVLIGTAPTNVFMATMKKRLRTKQMPILDQRVRMCTEVLSSIGIVKLFSWELPFMKRITEIRNAQLKYVYKELYLFGLMITILIITPSIASMATFATFGATGRVLTAADTFASLAFFNVLKFPLMQISNALMSGAQVLVASTRLVKFINTEVPEMEEDYKQQQHDSSTSGDSDIDHSQSLALELNNATFAWTRSTPSATTSDDAAGGDDVEAHALSRKQSEDFALRNMNLSIKRGSFTAVVGPVGAGKSSLISAIVGDMYQLKTNGGIFKTDFGKVALCTQDPWIFNDTVKNNILFGCEFDAERFREVLSACCLWSDLQGLPDREQTMIGERGVTLSGGQKARVSLARAAYCQPDTILLDDPLSALDAHVGKKIFDRLLSPKKGLLRHTTRVLVTHLVQYLGQCDKVVVMYVGRIAFEGPFKELLTMTPQQVEQQASQRAMLGDQATGQEEVEKQDVVVVVGDENTMAAGSLASVIHTLLQATQSDYERESESRDGGSYVQEAETTGVKKEKGPQDYDRIQTAGSLLGEGREGGDLMTKEELGEGNVKLAVIYKYIRASGGFGWMSFVLLLMTIERITYVCADLWLAQWANAAEGPIDLGFVELPTGNNTDGIRFYTNGYVIAHWVNIVFVTARTFAFMYGNGTAARNLFQALIWRLIRAPVQFFETTPLGRVVNRIAFDTETIDDELGRALNGMVASSMWMITALIVMIAVTPLATVLIVPVMICFGFLQKYYRPSCIGIQRLDSTSRSPIQSSFRQTLDGLSTIRAFKQQRRFLKENTRVIQVNNSAIFATVAGQRWLGVRLEFMGGVIMLGVAISAWMARDTISSGLVGLAILWTMNLTTSFNFFVTMSTLAEAKLVSVERVTAYSAIEQEPELATTGSKPPPEWPTRGEIVFENVVMRYRADLPPAVNDLSFRIAAGNHVGVCGRTGAGKSSLSVAMFRMRELTSGRITVDGIDLAGLGLADVRSRAMFIVPQSAVLFSGTIRFNLDPFTEYSTAQCLAALERARMAQYVSEVGGLDAMVEEGGSNFSQGQRQLLCLARAVLREPRVLVLDEATSSVDFETDKHIQAIIRDVFHQTTVIEIAHRLQSIMDCDQVMVLDLGRLVEMDSPEKLLQVKDGMFASLVDSTGPAMRRALRGMVKTEVQDS